MPNPNYTIKKQEFLNSVVNKIGRQRAQSGLYSNSRDACESFRVKGINDDY